MARKARSKYPRHATTHQVVEAVFDASEELSGKMHGWLDLLHPLREELMSQRADNRTEQRAVRAAGGKPVYTTKNDQYRYITGLFKTDRRFGDVHSQVLQNVADRVDKGTTSFVRGDTGPLRPMPRKKYRSFTFTQYGSAAKIRGGRLHLSKLGSARLIGLRKLPGRVKAVTMVFKQGRWFAQFLCEIQVQHDPRRARNRSEAVARLHDTGVDTGLTHVANLADGKKFTPAKPLTKALPLLRREQRKMSRQFEARKKAFAAYRKEFKRLGLCGPVPERDTRALSGRLKRQIRRVAILHTRVECVRRDQQRKLARRIEQRYRCVAVEEHGVEFMKRRRRTSRSVSDVAPAQFKSILKHALGEGRYVPVANRRPGIGGNSQACLCGASVPKGLEDRWHSCPSCGLEADRDTVSANIAMLIAFGYSNLGADKPPEPGQGLVRRGEVERSAGQPARPRRKATETPRKRPSSSDRRSSCTAGAQATAAVKNTQLLDEAPALHLSG